MRNTVGSRLSRSRFSDWGAAAERTRLRQRRRAQVDLGTTFSVAAVSEKGLVRVFKDAEGEVLTPSAVAFLPAGRLLVGRQAREHPEARHVIYDAKRFIGRRFSEPSVQAQAAGYSFAVVANGSETVFALDVSLGHGVAVAPEEVGAHVVRYLKSIAMKDLGHGIRQAVICVPASFGPEQIRATGDAFKRAGLSIARIMPEPVAAACAYGLQRKPNISHILVYDFGGGTLDVSVLYVRDGSIEVVTNGGDNDLGGTDFDHCIAKHLGVHDVPTLPCGRDDRRVCSPHNLLHLATEIKLDLSDEQSATRFCLAGLTCETLQPINLTLSRPDFETRVCGHLFDRAISVVDRTLTEAMIDTEDIDEVVLVGGSTRIPKVRSQLKVALRVNRLNTDIDPDVTVAVGAASVLD